MSLNRMTKKFIAVMMSVIMLLTVPGIFNYQVLTPVKAEQPSDGNGAVPDGDNGSEEFQSPVYVPAGQTFGNSRLGGQANNTYNQFKQKMSFKWQRLKGKISQKTGINFGRPAPQAPSHFGKVTLMDRIRNLTRGYIGGSRSVSVATSAAVGGGPVTAASYVGASQGTSFATPPLSQRGKGRGKAFALGIATGAGAVIAFPFLATGVGAAAGGVAAVGAGVFGLLSGAAAAVLGGAATVLGFVTGLVFSPIFLPALLIGGAIALAWYLLKKRKRQNPNLGNGSGIGWEGPVSIGASPDLEAIPGGGAAAPSPNIESAPVVSAGGPAAPAADLQDAYQRYIQSYNKYLGIINYTPGASTPDQAMQNNLNSDQAKSALKEYKDAYNDYIQLRQSGAK
ncbi:hypothetical protein ACFL35_05230 [Candidatus Riflebacteria bacterium]